VLAVRVAVSEAIDRARAGAGPSLIHALTYRIGGHFMTDPEVYRSAEEVAGWRAKDPIDRLAGQLIADGHESSETITAIQVRARDTMADAIERALAATDADPSVLRDGVPALGGGR
jgi:TPP-dependent pyruvate/acetoin dehydrogenase alpha subunit